MNFRHELIDTQFGFHVIGIKVGRSVDGDYFEPSHVTDPEAKPAFIIIYARLDDYNWPGSQMYKFHIVTDGDRYTCAHEIANNIFRCSDSRWEVEYTIGKQQVHAAIKNLIAAF